MRRSTGAGESAGLETYRVDHGKMCRICKYSRAASARLYYPEYRACERSILYATRGGVERLAFVSLSIQLQTLPKGLQAQLSLQYRDIKIYVQSLWTHSVLPHCLFIFTRATMSKSPPESSNPHPPPCRCRVCGMADWCFAKMESKLFAA